MPKSFIDSIRSRRSYYSLTPKSSVSDSEIVNLIEDAMRYVPSAFNSQSTRILLLLKDEHHKLWELVVETLVRIIPEEQIKKSETKIETSFKSGYGTILFFEDSDVVKSLQEKFPLYADAFPVYSQHTNAMHQFSVWCMLEDAGMGASLQHYNPLIDDKVHEAWNLPKSWLLTAQMPFGIATDIPVERSQTPLSSRFICHPP